MSHPERPTILGSPLSPVSGDIVQLVEGTLGNPILLDNDAVREGDDFYILFAGQKGLQASAVADLVRSKYKLGIRPSHPSAKKNSLPDDIPIEVSASAEDHRHMLDPGVRDALRFRPDLEHLAFKFGNNADYFMIACHFRKEDHDKIFSDESRAVSQPEEPNNNVEEPLPPSFINSRKFDLLFHSAQQMGESASPERGADAIHWGGLAVYDRRNPDGSPDIFQIARLSDVHVAKDADDLDLKVIRKKDDQLYLRFNNPNNNFQAIIDKLNSDYRQGRLDLVILMGDNIDHDGTEHEVSQSLADSNTILLAHFLKQIEAPTVVMKGNHDSLAEAPPGSIMADNYQITKDEANALQKDRYGGGGTLPLFGPIYGQGLKLADALGSVLYNRRALRAYHDVINPFEDMKLTLHDNPPREEVSLPPVSFVFLDTGHNDLAHFKQDDEIYYDQLQDLWPWQLPFLHPISIWDLATGRSPDLHGPSRKQLIWLAHQSFSYCFGHAPLIDSEQHEDFHTEGEFKLKPLRFAGGYRENNYGTMWHNGRELIRTFLSKPEFLAYIGGHGHNQGHAGVIGLDDKNEEVIYRGPVLETLRGLAQEEGKSNVLAAFWHPGENLNPSSSPVVRDFFGESASEVRDHKFYWQVGSSTVGVDPLYTVMTFTPNGLIKSEKYFYPVKEIVADPDDPSGKRHRVHVAISEKPLGNNDRLVLEWKKIQKKIPGAFLDTSRSQFAIDFRAKTDSSQLVANADSLKPYPELKELVEEPIISRTKIDRHYRLRLMANPESWSNPSVIGASLERVFSQEEVSYIGRSLLIEGLEAGWFYDAARTHHVGIGWVSPDIFDWRLPLNVTLRGPNIALGPELKIRQDGKVEVGVYDVMKALDISLRGDRSDWEFSYSLRRENIFSDNPVWLHTLNIDRAF